MGYLSKRYDSFTLPLSKNSINIYANFNNFIDNCQYRKLADKKGGILSDEARKKMKIEENIEETVEQTSFETFVLNVGAP